ncbi:hypothetical protein DPSP01_002189 [Paraphaeosphaeria sporulosa]|uniref:RNA-binding domain-containing protein n=1 Tax=Paraphaeosphaeria sporulosa TaxID=1460663 RepID=A0A177C222_9PLEO|nr:RNA-binding domain-containing protein [Paraphaeosphaeria sporulosa]OAG00680.1 RNA-binding domain-containing protein [Paraphaeosphaeria sporulosa]
MASLARPPPPQGLPAKVHQTAPNRTLYVRNLPDKLPKEDLKRNLYMLFATYGVILDVVALKTPKMRGQAHVVFRDIDSSTQAMRALEGAAFFGKDMHIAYAKTKSDTIAKLDGTFKMPEPDLPEKQLETTEQTGVAATVFGSAPAKAVPVNEQERAKGTKRGREEEEKSESEDDDEEMQMSESDEE